MNRCRLLTAAAAVLASLTVVGAAQATSTVPGGAGCVDTVAATTATTAANAPSTTAAAPTTLAPEASSTSSVPAGFTYSSPEGDISVVFPGQPALETIEYTDPPGATATYARYATQTMEFLAFRYVYPDPTSMPTLQEACEGGIATAQATLLSSAPTKVEGYPGIDYTATAQGQYVVARFFDGPIVGVRYSLIVASTGELTFDSPEVTAFMESVVITPPATTGATPPATTGAAGDSTTTSLGAAATVPADWFPFVSPDGDFTVSFPGEPESTNEDLTLPDGTVVPFALHSYDEGGYSYAVSRGTYQPGTAVSLEGARDGSIANVGGTLASSTAIELQGHPGLEFTGTVASGGVQGRLISRVYAVDNVLYQLLVVGPEQFGTADANAFLDSFTFTGAAAQ
jgi:hypothetical protein